MLYLYKHIKINTLIPNSQLHKITTNNTQINLITQNITSKNLITLYKTTFNSNNLKIHNNLHNKNTKLIKKIKTSYKIQNKQTQP